MTPWPIAVPAAVLGAAGIAAWGAVHSTSQIFGPTLHQTSRRSAIALTFDDGPNPAVTPRMLALLERYEVRASFFLLGRYARACPELVREIASHGHAIGNHTETHPNLTFQPPRQIVDELQRCQASIAWALAPTVTNVPVWMRPPFGFRGPQLASAVRRAGLRGVAMWSHHVYDWKPQSPAQLIARLARVAKDASSAVPDPHPRNAHGPILLLHDGDFRQQGADRRHLVPALEHWLPRWRDAGLEFVTIDDAACST